MEHTNKISYTTDLRTVGIKTCDPNVYQEMCQNFNCYEIIPNDRKFKPYFDIEIKQKHCKEGQEYVDCWKECLKYATKFLDKEFPGANYCFENASSADYKCCVTGEQKWITSLHIKISNYLVSKIKLKSLVIKMNQAIINEFNDKNNRCEKVKDFYDFPTNADDKYSHEFFDKGVYDTNRKLRSPYANKMHYDKDTNVNTIEDRPMELVFGTFEQTVIGAFNDPDSIEIPDDVQFQPISPSPTSVANLHNVEQQQQQGKTNKYEELLEIIGQGSKVYKILHPMWFQIGSILKTNGYDKAIFQNFTEQFVPNKLKELDKIWECIHMTTVYSIFILQKMAKEINLTGYNIWFIKHKQYISIKTLRAGNNDIAKVISDRLKDELVYCNKMWILFDKKTNLWRVTDAPQTKVCNFIQHLIDCSLETLMYKINRTHDDDELKWLDVIRGCYGNFRCSMADNKENSMIVKLLRDYLYDSEFCSKLDVNIYKVAYKNGILDLKTLEFREGLLPSDMLTQTIPYNYEKASKADIDAIRFEILKICNYNETHLDYYLSALGYAMTGDSIKLQEFYYIIGQKASNGKSVIFEALNDIIPCYSKKIESSAFELKNSQLHKEIATWKGIRVGWINELTKNKQDAEIIKQVADGTSIKYKVMYGVSDNMPITFKPFIISNHSITIDADAGIARRVRLCQMDSEFIDGLETDNFETCQFKRDNNFGDALRTTYKFALMDLIYSYSYKFAQTNKLSTYPVDWNEEKKNCLDDNNVFAGFVKTHFEFDATYEISEYSLKNYLKQNKFENIKFRDEVKKNKWNIKRNNEGKKWVGFRIKDEIEE